MIHRFIFAGVLFISVSSFAAPTLLPHSCYQGQPDICIDSTPCKSISGITACLSGVPASGDAVTLDASCWQYQAQFTCEDSASVNSCQPLFDQGCAQIGTSCITFDSNNTCAMTELTMSCPDQSASSTQQTVCDSSFCQSGSAGCFDTSHPPDKDFGQAAAMMEVSREAGVYGVSATKIEIFKGYNEECSVKVLGGATLKSCCKSSGGGGAFTNYVLLGQAISVGAGVAGSAGTQVVKTGSKYVYDSLYGQTDITLVDKGVAAMNSWADSLGSGAAATPTFGAYGVTFSFSLESGFEFVSFDPYSFAAQVAILMIQEWLSCSTNEQVLSMKKGQNLCVFIGSYCAHKIPIINVCTEKREQACCFNSILAKIVNRQGRAQLGLPGNQCGGFNEAQLQSLDFSAMDFSEFIATITPPNPNVSSRTSTVNASVQQKVQNYYNQ